LLARAADIAASIENFRLMRIFAQTLMTICVGEIRQDFGGNHWPPNQEEYYQHIDSKTATLFSACTEGGAVLSGGSEEEIQALKAYGHYLGLAFQIADDILDFTADESVLGKPVGSDLRQGTFTLPVFHFIAQDARGVKLAELLHSNGQNVAEMDALIDAIRQSPAIDSAKTEARRFAQLAQDTLAIFPDIVYRRVLSDLAMYVVERAL
jgi:geranylgeranyl pyrophosphate synthase